jgi:hypothetical protein
MKPPHRSSKLFCCKARLSPVDVYGDRIGKPFTDIPMIPLIDGRYNLLEDICGCFNSFILMGNSPAVRIFDFTIQS